MNSVKVYTDGACKGNPGPAGIGIVIIKNGVIKEHSEFLGNKTNNIAELSAILRALELIENKNDNITIYTDSQYVIGLFTGKYKAKKNIELINKIKKEINKFNNIKFEKVKGHSTDYYNNLADKLAVESITKK